MEQNSIEVKTNRDHARKRLSALAQLVRMLARDGIVTIADQARETGYSPRQVSRARTELGWTADTSVGGAS